MSTTRPNNTTKAAEMTTLGYLGNPKSREKGYATGSKKDYDHVLSC